MLRAMPLPPLPEIALREVEDLSPPAERGYLRLRRSRLTAQRPGGEPSEPFVYDSVERTALDAVVVAALFVEDGRRMVYLRSAVRPPVYLRPLERRPLPEKATLGVLWELPAGLVEDDECSPEGLRRCASRELEEELGFAIDPARFEPLGPPSFPSGGVIGERHHYFQVAVDPSRRGTPAEDGSVLERDALIAAVTLEEAISLCLSGEIEDSKTEIALHRLGRIFSP
jgi:ADP-ribose pyrophosphatase